MSNYQAVAAQGFAPPTSPHQATTRAGYTTTNTSPGPLTEIYNSSNAENVANYVQAASPQPSGFPPIGVSRAPISYNPVCCWNKSNFLLFLSRPISLCQPTQQQFQKIYFSNSLQKLRAMVYMKSVFCSLYIDEMYSGGKNGEMFCSGWFLFT